MRIIAVILVCLAMATVAGCGGDSGMGLVDEQPAPDTPSSARLNLPEPRLQGEVSVEEALDRRESRRAYGEGGLDLSGIGQLLWSAAGLGVDAASGATRTAPSAGGIYPVDIYLVSGEMEDLDTGIYLYDPQSHSLVTVATGDVREELADAALSQSFISQAPISIVMTTDYDKSTGRYGDRGERYAHMDAACAAENVSLQAEAMGLGTVMVGAFDDKAVAEIIHTSGDPLIIMPVGAPQ